ncbi:MAG: RodZ domain-containing protein [Rhodospirillales bacterium]
MEKQKILSHELDDALKQAKAHGVGALLKASRLRVGDNVREISDVLRIRHVYLEAIEDGRFDDLPGPTYATGFIRVYAEYLGLDSEEVVRRYKADISGDGDASDRNLVFPEPIPEPGIPGGAVVFVGIVVAVVAYGVWYVNTTKDGFLAELISPVPERLADAAAKGAGGQATSGATPETAPPAKKEAEEKTADATVSASAPEEAAKEPVVSPEASPEPPPEEARPEITQMAAAPVKIPEKAPEMASEMTQGMTPEAVPAPQPDTQQPVTASVQEAAPAPVIIAPEGKVAPVTLQATPQATPEVVAQPPPKTKPEPQPEPQPVVEEPSRDIVSTPFLAPAPVPVPETASLPPALTSPGTSGGASAGTGKVTVRAVTNSWIQIRDDIAGELLLTRLLRAGDHYEVPDRKGLKLSTGNAGALEILVDGKTVPSIGGAGDVRRNVALDAGKLKAGTAVGE